MNRIPYQPAGARWRKISEHVIMPHAARCSTEGYKQYCLCLNVVPTRFHSPAPSYSTSVVYGITPARIFFSEPRTWLWHLSPVPWDERGSGQAVRRMGADIENIWGLCTAGRDCGAHQRGGTCVQSPETVGNSTKTRGNGLCTRKRGTKS